MDKGGWGQRKINSITLLTSLRSKFSSSLLFNPHRLLFPLFLFHLWMLNPWVSFSDRKSAALLLTMRNISQVAEQRGRVFLRKSWEVCCWRLLHFHTCAVSNESSSKRCWISAQRAREAQGLRAIPSVSAPTSSTIACAATDNTAVSQPPASASRHILESDREAWPTKSSCLCSAGAEEGGRGEQGGMRNGGWDETHSCFVKPKSDRPKCCPVAQQTAW